jgi:hemerythrin-like domain-containing protein
MLQGAGVAAGTVLVLGPYARGEEPKKEDAEEARVTPPEDLMREHGVLYRLLLIYERGLAPGSAPPARKELSEAAGIIANFIGNYHEKLEEDYVFPKFQKAGELTELVTVLRGQHQAGRRLTSDILQATAQPVDNSSRERLTRAIGAFIRMYRPHAARESTVLFPQLQAVVSPQEYEQMGATFEEIEHQKFGPAGFEGVVAGVADLERRLGLYDLAEFTPKSI